MRLPWLLRPPRLTLAEEGGFHLEFGVSAEHRTHKRPGFVIKTPIDWQEREDAETGTIALVLVADDDGLEGVVVDGPLTLEDGLTFTDYLAHRLQTREAGERIASAMRDELDVVEIEWEQPFGEVQMHLRQHAFFWENQLFLVTVRCPAGAWPQRQSALASILDSFQWRRGRIR